MTYKNCKNIYDILNIYDDFKLYTIVSSFLHNVRIKINFIITYSFYMLILLITLFHTSLSVLFYLCNYKIYISNCMQIFPFNLDKKYLFNLHYFVHFQFVNIYIYIVYFSSFSSRSYNFAF